MFDRNAIAMVRWVAWFLLAGGIVATVGLAAPVVALWRGGQEVTLGSPLLLLGCGAGLLATFLWAILLLQAMNAENLQRIRQLIEDGRDPS